MDSGWISLPFRSFREAGCTLRGNVPGTGNGDAGFTLTEVIVICTVLAILSAIAIPGFAGWLPNYRLRSAARDLFSNFQLAKQTAIKRGTHCTVSFNQSIGGVAYDYVVYVDADQDLEYDAGEEVIGSVLLSDRYRGVELDTSQGGGDGLSFMNNDNGLPSVAFLSNGVTCNNTGGAESGTAYLKNSKGRTESVSVSALGNIRID